MTSPADHFIVLVKDIEAAARDYQSLGFTVQTRADSQSHGAHYRFIVLADGAYILLTQFTSDEVIATHRLGPDLRAGEGFADWSFTIPDAEATAEAVKMAGGETRGPVTVANVLATGEAWGLKLLMTGKGTGGDSALPFVVEDTHGRGFRIPAFQPHANGIERIAEIRASSDDPLKAAAILGATLDAPVTATRVESLPAPVVFTATHETAGHARARGGLYELVVTGSATKGLMDCTLTHGARILRV